VTLIVTSAAYGFSLTFAEMLFQQATYLWWPAGFLLGAALVGYFRSAKVSVLYTTLAPFLLFVLIFSISFANPARVLIMMVGPLYVFDAALRVDQRVDGFFFSRPLKALREIFGTNDALTLFGLGGGFVFAAVSYLALRHFGITQTVDGVTDLRWAGWSSVWAHGSTFLRGWFYYLGIDSFSIPTQPGAMITWALRACVPIALTCVGINELTGLRRQREVVRRALGFAFAAAFFPLLLIYLLFEPLANGLGTARYFTVPMIILLVIAAYPLRNFVRSSPGIGLSALTAAGIVLAVLSVQLYVPIARADSASFWEISPSPPMQLAALLKKEGLRWGYATWWNAGASTVFANSESRVSPVVIAPYGIYPSNSMVSKRWYRPSAWTGETFLALAANEADPRTLDMLSALIGEPSRVVESAGYRVLVYGRNIASGFACFAGTHLDTPLAHGPASVRVVSADITVVGESRVNLLEVHISNDGNAPVSGVGRLPLSIGVQLLDEAGNIVVRDWLHAPLICPLAPGSESDMKIALPVAAAGRWKVRVDLVQEGVAWFQDQGVAPIDLDMIEDRPTAASSIPVDRLVTRQRAM